MSVERLENRQGKLDPDDVVCLLQPTLQHRCHVQRLGNGLDVRVLFEESGNRGDPGDLEIGKLGEGVDDSLGEALCEGSLVLGLSEVRAGHDGYRGLD